jgi:3-oxoacyl-[acyl-carrier-protein] synthase-3
MIHVNFWSLFLKKKQARITGIGSYLPQKKLTNQDLENLVDTSDEWIVSRTGMKERRIALSEEKASDLGVEAAKKALDDARISKESVDYLLVSTMTPDYITPSTAALIQKKLELKEIPALDVSSACTGFLYTLELAKALIESGLYETILVVATEKMSSVIDYEDRATCVLFGDGAAAVVVRAFGAGLLIEESVLGTDGSLAHLMTLNSFPDAPKERFFQMEGKEIFKHAVRRMSYYAKTCLEKANLSLDQIRWIIPHQANLRIISAIAKGLEIDESICYKTLHKYGNTSSSTIGIALDELLKESPLQEKDHILLLAFGGGLTFGALLLSRID